MGGRLWYGGRHKRPIVISPSQFNEKEGVDENVWNDKDGLDASKERCN